MTLSIETITIQDIQTSDAVTLDEFVATLEPGSAALFWALTLIVEYCADSIISCHVFRKVGERNQQVA